MGNAFFKVVSAGTTQVVLNEKVAAQATYTFTVAEIDPFGGEGTLATSSNFVIPANFAGPALTAPSLVIA